MAFKLNGKKTPIALVIFIITAAIGYGTLQADVKHNKVAVVSLKGEPIKIARLEQDMSSVIEDVSDIKQSVRDMRIAQSLGFRDIKDLIILNNDNQ